MLSSLCWPAAATTTTTAAAAVSGQRLGRLALGVRGRRQGRTLRRHQQQQQHRTNMMPWRARSGSGLSASASRPILWRGCRGLLATGFVGLAGLAAAYWARGDTNGSDRVDPTPQSSKERLKLLLAASFSSVLGYIGVRYFRVLHCQTDDSVSNSSRDIPIASAKIDEALRNVHEKLSETCDDIREAIDLKAEELWQLVKDKYMDDSTERVFQCIDDILVKLQKFSKWNDEDFSKPLFILLGLILKAQNQSWSVWRNLGPGAGDDSVQLDGNRSRLHKHLSQHAINIYDASLAGNSDAAAEQLGLETPDDLLFARFEDADEDHCPKFAVILDRKISSVVLVVRGTFSVTDVFLDVVCDEEPFLNGFAHKGILQGARKVIQECLPTLRAALNEHPSYRLFITGHSLGAATAQLITMEFLHNQSLLPHDTDLHCVALAPPPVFRANTSLSARVRGQANQLLSQMRRRSSVRSSPAVDDVIDIYVNSQDCVPRLSLASIAQLLSVLRAVDAVPLNAYQTFQILAGLTGPEVEANLARLQEAIDRVNQNTFPYLEHPGKIHFLCKEQEEEEEDEDVNKFIVSLRESRHFTRHLMILDRMVLDHLKPSYREALERAFPGN